MLRDTDPLCAVLRRLRLLPLDFLASTDDYPLRIKYPMPYTLRDSQTEENMSNKCTTIVNNSLWRTRDLPNNAWTQQHQAAWHNPRGTERGIRAMLEGFAAFADAHETEDYTIGQDGFFGPHAEDMIQALLAMLNLQCGRFDCGTLDRLIRELAVAAGVELGE